MEATISLDVGSGFGTFLYGEGTPEAPALASRIISLVKELSEGEVLSLSLSSVEVIDLGFMIDLYSKLGTTGWPGRAIVYEGCQAHASVGALPYRFGDSKMVVLELDDGTIRLHGRHFIQSYRDTEQIYLACLKHPEGTTSDSLMPILRKLRRGASLGNASNLLCLLRKFGLLQREKNPANRYGYLYRPIFPDIPIETDWGNSEYLRRIRRR